jgi:hypothetical protein
LFDSEKAKPQLGFVIVDYFTEISSVSKIKVAFGGITPPAPRLP